MTPEDKEEYIKIISSMYPGIHTQTINLINNQKSMYPKKYD